MAINILVTEDESIVRKDIERCLVNLGYNVVASADNGEDAIDLALKHKPDLALMDIMIKGDMNGIAAAEEIKRNIDIPVVFLTAYADENTLNEAKMAEPHGYILKPFKDVDIQTAIEMALHKHGKEQELKMESEFLRSLAEHKVDADVIFVKNRSKFVRVKNEDLLFVEALKDYVVVHTRKESYTIHSTMKDVEQKLNPRLFVRVHRSFIVNIEAIESIKYAMIQMEGMEKEIPVGGSYKDLLAQRINLL
ncbi:MAG: LytR/AlgR family response regulator transcription factor [Flavobacteriales bacterium]|jgi:two-component system response regulator LytT